MQALRRKVIIEPFLEKKEKTDAGIYLPGSQDVGIKITKGTVVSVGVDVDSIKTGDIVLFSPFHYDEIDETHYVLDEEDIWAIVE